MGVKIVRPPPKVVTKKAVAAGKKGTLPPMPEPVKKKFRARASTIDWPNLKETWMLSHLNNKPMTLGQVALKFNASASTVANKSSEEKWAEELAFKMKNRDDIVATALTERSTQAVQRLNEDFITAEVEVRRRHALMAKGLQAKGMAALKAIKIEHLKPMEAIAMLRLGLDEERLALGLDEKAAPGGAEESKTLDKEYRPIVEQISDHKRVQQMGVALLRRLQQGSSGQVEDAKILTSVGITPGQTK